MAKKKEQPAGFNDPAEVAYVANLKVGEESLARITIRAKTDEDAREQLERAKPTYFEGIGHWFVTKMDQHEVEF